MELYATIDLPLAKKPLVTTGYEALDEPQSRSGRYLE
jgi:hypothetical protein